MKKFYLDLLTFKISNEGFAWSSFCNFAFIRTSGRTFCKLWSIPPTNMSPFFVTQPTYVLLCDFPDLTKKDTLSIRKTKSTKCNGIFCLSTLEEILEMMLRKKITRTTPFAILQPHNQAFFQVPSIVFLINFVCF